MSRQDGVDAESQRYEQGGKDADLARDIREAAAAFRDLVQEAPGEKLYWYWSIKAQSFVRIRGDTAFMMVVLDETNADVVRLEVEAPSAIETVEGEPTGTRFDARTFLRDGSQVWKEAKRASSIKEQDERARYQLQAQREAAAKAGARYLTVTDEDLRRHQVRFWNSLALLGWHNRARGIPNVEEQVALMKRLEGRAGVRLDELLALEGTDPALMLAALAKRVAFGSLYMDLDRPITRRSFVSLKPGGESTETDEDHRPPSLTQPPALTSAARLPAWGDYGDRSQDLLDMSRWPQVDVTHVRDRELFDKRRMAVEMLYGCRSAEDIRRETGLSSGEVVDLVMKCSAPTKLGGPKGFPALVKWGYLRPYKRTAETPASNRVEGAKGGGWSGEFERLLSEHDDLLTLLEEQTLQKYSARAGKRLKWSDIRDAFVNKVKMKVADKTLPPEKRLPPTTWPLGTKKLGYQTIMDFCKELKQGRRSKWVAAREGRAAGERAALGNGRTPLFVPMAPYQAAAADFHKEDAETVASIDLPDGTTVTATLPRWWIGAMVCMHSGAPIADSVSLERQTTLEDVMALGEALTATPPPSPELARDYRVTPDGKWLLGQLVPALANNAVDLLMMDRAWAHLADQPLAKLAQTMGCVICFGSSKSWWQRAPVERYFADIVASLHTVPSSVGSHPKDPRREGAAKAALRYRIDVDRIVSFIRARSRELLEKPGAGSFGVGHVGRLHQLCLNHESPWLPRPLPGARQRDNPLTWVDLDTKIVAGPNRNYRAPHVRPMGIRFHGDELAQRDDLVGSDVVVQIKRMRFLEARVVQVVSGHVIGPVTPERRYAFEGLTYRMVRLSLQHRSLTDPDLSSRNPVIDFANHNTAIVAKRAAKGGQPKRDEPPRAGTEGLRAASMSKVALRTSADEAEKRGNNAGHGSSLLDSIAGNAVSIGSFARKRR